MANGMPVVLGQSNSATNVTSVDCSTTADASLSVQTLCPSLAVKRAR